MSNKINIYVRYAIDEYEYCLNLVFNLKEGDIMGTNLLEGRMDYLFRKLYGCTISQMNLQDFEGIIMGIDAIDNFYDDSYTYFILPDVDAFWEYNLYRVLGSGKYGFTIEELGYIDPDEVCGGIIDENGKCHWERYKEDRFWFEIIVKQLKEKYGFDGLYHVTDFSNLQNIFNSEYLRSRNECEYNNISFMDSASSSVMSHTSLDIRECVRFYYRPKSPTLYVNEGIKLKDYMNTNPHLPIPVYLVFDEELIYLDTTEFTDRNAGCNDVNVGNNFKLFYNVDWEKVFGNRYYIGEWRNKMQAELLSKVPVSLDYLNKIIFRCEADMKRAINLFGYDNRYVVNLKVFSDKNNYSSCKPWHYNNFIKDYHIRHLDKTVNLDMLLLDIQFQKPWENYETNILIKNRFGKILKRITFDYSTSRKTNERYSMQLLFDDFKENYYKLEVYLNDILCIEEYLEKYR